MPSHHLILFHPLLVPSVFPSIMVFSSKPALHTRWPKYWYFSFRSSPTNEYSGLISFRKDWFDLLSIQGTLKSLLQHHSSKASILSGPFFWLLDDYLLSMSLYIVFPLWVIPSVYKFPFSCKVISPIEVKPITTISL